MQSLLDMHWHIPVCVCLGETLSENVVHFGVTSWTRGKGWGRWPAAAASPLGFDLEKLLRYPGASHVWKRGCWVGRVMSSHSFSPGLYCPELILVQENTWLSPTVSGGGWQAPLPTPASALKLPLFICSPGNVSALTKVARGMIIKYSLPPLLIYVSLQNLQPTEVTGKFIFSSVPISTTLKLDWT